MLFLKNSFELTTILGEGGEIGFLTMVKGRQICLDGIKNLDSNIAFSRTELAHACYLKIFHETLRNLGLLSVKRSSFLSIWHFRVNEKVFLSLSLF